MSKEKRVGRGTVVSVDHDGDNNFDVVGCIRNATPPPRSKEPIDSTCLSDDVEDFELGVEAGGDFVFTQAWQAGLAVDEVVDTLFGAETEVDWRISYPYSTPVTDTFPGKVIAIAPQVLETKTLITRQVTVRRTGPITRA